MKRLLAKTWAWITCWWGHAKIDRKLQLANQEAKEMEKVFRRLRRMVSAAKKERDALQDDLDQHSNELESVNQLLSSQQAAFDELRAENKVLEVQVEGLTAAYNVQLKRYEKEATIHDVVSQQFEAPSTNLE